MITPLNIKPKYIPSVSRSRHGSRKYKLEKREKKRRKDEKRGIEKARPRVARLALILKTGPRQRCQKLVVNSSNLLKY